MLEPSNEGSYRPYSPKSLVRVGWYYTSARPRYIPNVRNVHGCGCEERKQHDSEAYEQMVLA